MMETDYTQLMTLCKMEELKKEKNGLSSQELTLTFFTHYTGEQQRPMQANVFSSSSYSMLAHIEFERFFLFDSILIVSVNDFSVMSGRVFLG